MSEIGTLDHRDRPPAPAVVKRLLDVVVAATALIVTLPITVVAAVAVRAAMGSPVLFRQRRAGYLGKSFELLKFRTMHGPSVPGREALDDVARLSRLGRFLRRTSIDELPQLLNVLRGEMSLVGPRPLLLEYLPLYSEFARRRHEAKPGMTGWAQVKGRNALGWSEKFQLDVWYVDHWSLGLDLRILSLTLLHALDGRRVSADKHVTMPRFEGHDGAEHGTRRGVTRRGVI